MNLAFKAIDLDDVVVMIKVVLFFALLLACAAIGYNLGKNHNAKVIADQRIALASQHTAIVALANKIRAINRESAKAIAAAKRAQAAAQDAGKVAAKAEQLADKAQADYQRRLEAARKKPDCAVLLNTDVRKVCGL